MTSFNLFRNELSDRITLEYGELMEAGLSPESIVQVFLDRYEDELDDDLKHAVFWINLAKVQLLLEFSREQPVLHSQVRDSAIEAIRGLKEKNDPAYLVQKHDLDEILDDLLSRRG
ncbi:MAG: hypothetical protein QHH02_01970 [Syntrophomonadaceae bacterium]|nr:hypothetical protein [Syntrophomonadaceae bacterium]